MNASQPPPIPRTASEPPQNKSLIEGAKDGYQYLGERFFSVINKQTGLAWTPEETARNLFYAGLFGLFVQLCVWHSFFGFVYAAVIWSVVAGAVPWAIGNFIHASLQKEQTELRTWLEKLVGTGVDARKASFSFKPLSAARPFNLSFSFRVLLEMPEAKNLDAFRVRAKYNAGAGKEIEEIKKSLFDMIDKYARYLRPVVLQCANGKFWNDVETSFNDYLAPRIEEEYGYRIVISNLKREKNPLEEELDRMVDPNLKDRVQRNWQLLSEADQHYANVYRAHHDPEHPDVLKAWNNAEKLRTQFEEVKKAIHAAQLLPTNELPKVEQEKLLESELKLLADVLAGSVPRTSHLLLKQGSNQVT